MLNTFFFGYLKLKWRRLALVLSILFTPLTIFVFVAFDLSGMGEDESFSIGAVAHLSLVIIVSYTLKPFIVKK